MGSTSPIFCAQAPAKILLTGEHAVVYGIPAIAMAVNRFASTEISSKSGNNVFLNLHDIKSSFNLTVATLKKIKDRLLIAYKRFMEGLLSIRDVIQAPGELFQFALASFLDACALELHSGLNIKLHSTIPIGCGMGSSAATVVSFIRALLHHFRLNRGGDWIENLIFEIESLQHGTPSGVDSFISIHGGCVQFQKNEKPKKIPLPNTQIWAINTGQPICTTGECVSHVRDHWKNNPIWDEFLEISTSFEQALHKKQYSSLLPIVRQNHQLLKTIGVVPKKVDDFITILEHDGVAAKISGAGAIQGDSTGIVIVFSQDPPKELCEKFGYTYFRLEGENRGATINYS